MVALTETDPRTARPPSPASPSSASTSPGSPASEARSLTITPAALAELVEALHELDDAVQVREHVIGWLSARLPSADIRLLAPEEDADESPSTVDGPHDVPSSVLLEVAVRGRHHGVLQLRSRTPDPFGPADIETVEALALVTAVALDTVTERGGLRRAVEARRDVGVAIGMLVERFTLRPEAAFDVLRRYSQATNVKVRDLARRLVETGELPPTDGL